MTFPDHMAEPPGWAAPATQAPELLRLHRDQIVAYTTATADEPAADSAVALLEPEALPPDVVSLIQRYEAQHPGVHLSPLRYVRVGPPGESTAAAVSDAGVPGEDELVSLTITETVVDAERVEVHSRVLLAARASVEG